MDVTIVTTARTDAEALELLKLMGFPLAEAKEAPKEAPKEAAKETAKETPKDAPKVEEAKVAS
jgi:RNase P/RNase MRP subunit p30